MKATDSHELLRAYAEDHSESAFQELVHGYVDLVYSAAIRRVDGDTQLAEDVTQEVFTHLARKAGSLPPNVMLGGWLHRHTGFVASTAMRGKLRRRNRERQAAEMNALNEPSEVDWKKLGPALDEAMDELDAADRDALVLRYFERRELRAVGAALGVSDDTAGKRVSRALDKLREHLSRRGISSTATALSIVLSANAVQSAPAGLAITISTTAALAGTTIATAATATHIKAIAMITLQKTIIGATLAAALGIGIYEWGQTSSLRGKIQSLQQQQAPLAAQVENLTRERDEATNRLALLGEESERLKRNSGEVLRLRAQTARLRGDSEELDRRKWTSINAPYNTSDPDWKPNWGALRPVDLSQYADSTNIVTRDSATNVGTVTPMALVQTWLWALRTGDTEGLLKTIEFPEGTTEAKKAEFVSGVQSRKPADADQFQNYSLRELLSLGGDRYLALIEEWRLTPADAWVGHKILYRVGGEWKIR